MTNAVVYGYNFLPEVGIEQNLGLKQHGGVRISGDSLLRSLQGQRYVFPHGSR